MVQVAALEDPIPLVLLAAQEEPISLGQVAALVLGVDRHLVPFQASMNLASAASVVADLRFEFFIFVSSRVSFLLH